MVCNNNMKLRRCILLVFFLLTAAVEGMSQSPYPWYQPVKYHKREPKYWEIVVGGTSSNLYYQGSIYNKLNKSYGISPTVGLAFRKLVSDYVTLSVQFDYTNSGVKIQDDINYKFDPSYVSMLFQVERFWCRDPRSRDKKGPFVSIAPYVSTPVSGNIVYENFKIDLSKANIRPFDVGAEVGVGYRLCTFSETMTTNIRFKLAYRQGFVDTYSPMEKSGEAVAVNLPDYVISGRRLNQMLLLTVGIEFPFKQKSTTTFVAGGDSYHVYKRFANLGF